MFRRCDHAAARILLACAVVIGLTGCIPIRLRSHAYQQESVQTLEGHQLSLQLKPRQGATLGPPPRTFSLVFAIEGENFAQLAPKLLRVELHGVEDSTVQVITAPTASGFDTSGTILSLMHLSLPLRYQEYRVNTMLEWTICGRQDTLAMTWTQRPKPQYEWFFWPWQMYTDG